MKIIDLEQGTPEWEEFRRDKIGASDIPIICGKSPYKTPVQLWKEKMGEKQVYVTDAMKRGKALEEDQRKMVNELYTTNFKPMVAVHDTLSWMITSFDGVDIQNEIILEIKTTNTENFQKLISDFKESERVPLHFIYQVQQGFLVSGYKEGLLHITDGKDSFTSYLSPDPSILKEIEEEGYNFWLSMRNWEKPKEKHVEREDLQEKFFRRSQIKRQIKKLQEEEDLLALEMISNANGESISCGPFKFTKSLVKGNVNYKNIPEIQGIDLEKYRHPSYLKWTFTQPRDKE